MQLNREICRRARLSRDARFDGKFFIAVRTTRIFCRPVCPARSPKEENVDYYPSAAAALQAGFRPCLRCRPESWGTPAWDGTSTTVTRALRLIDEGALEVERSGCARRTPWHRIAALAPLVLAASGRHADRRGASAASALRQEADRRDHAAPYHRLPSPPAMAAFAASTRLFAPRMDAVLASCDAGPKALRVRSMHAATALSSALRLRRAAQLSRQARDCGRGIHSTAMFTAERLCSTASPAGWK